MLLNLLPDDRSALIDITDVLLNIVGRGIGDHREMLLQKAGDIYLRCNGIRQAAIKPIPGYRGPPPAMGGD